MRHGDDTICQECFVIYGGTYSRDYACATRGRHYWRERGTDISICRPLLEENPPNNPPSPICSQPKYVDRRPLLQEAAASPTPLSATIHSFIPPLPLDMIWSSLTWTALAAFCVGVSSRKITPYTDGYINYTTVPGYFLQDDPTTNASTFNYVCPHHARLPTRRRRRRITSDLQDLDQFWPDQSNL